MIKNLQTILFLAAVLFSSNAMAQCSELFISEYVEGSNNNKALEIANPTDSPVDLSDYRIIRWSNGNASYDELYALDLSGTLAAKDVAVFVLDKQDCSLGGQDTCVFEGLQMAADQFVSPVYDDNRTLYHNGDDAISLNKISDDSFAFGGFVDIFGLIGEDPGSSWTDTFPFVQAAGGAFWTRDQTLLRKPTITAGVTTNPGAPDVGSWDPTLEWDTLPRNTFDHLGFHECDCGYLGDATGIRENVINDASLEMYPNPSNGTFTVESSIELNAIEVYTISGQLVAREEVAAYSKQLTLDVPTGQYFVKMYYAGNKTSFDKLMIK